METITIETGAPATEMEVHVPPAPAPSVHVAPAAPARARSRTSRSRQAQQVPSVVPMQPFRQRSEPDEVEQVAWSNTGVKRGDYICSLCLANGTHPIDEETGEPAPYFVTCPTHDRPSLYAASAAGAAARDQAARQVEDREGTILAQAVGRGELLYAIVKVLLASDLTEVNDFAALLDEGRELRAHLRAQQEAARG